MLVATVQLVVNNICESATTFRDNLGRGISFVRVFHTYEEEDWIQQVQSQVDEHLPNFIQFVHVTTFKSGLTINKLVTHSYGELA